MKKTVLIVDDEEAITLCLAHLMRREGYTVHTVADGDSALSAVADFRPDLVLLDLMIPGRDGYDVCQTLRADPANRDLKIVMVTARGREVETQKGLALGADAYVTKPFSTRDLADAVANLLEREPVHG